MAESRVGLGQNPGSKATQFKPGWKGGPGRPRKAVSDTTAGSATPLEDMRHVYTHPPSKDRTPGQRRCRQFFEDDFKGFVALYMKLEEAHRAEVAAAATGTSTEVAPSPKETCVEELAERLLAAWEAEESGRTGQ